MGDGYGTCIRDLAFSPDGKRIALASGFKAAVWHVNERRELVGFEGHMGSARSVWSIAFSPDGKTVASVDGGKTIRVWEAGTGKEILNVTPRTSIRKKGGPISVGTVEFSPDGKLLASGSSDEGTVRLWSVATGREVLSLRTKGREVHDVTFSPDGKVVAAGWDYNNICIWEVASGRELFFIERCPSAACVAFSPDGRMLAAGGGETVALWDVPAAKKLLTLKADTRGIRSLAFSPDGKTLAAAGTSSIHAWDLPAEKQRPEFVGHGGGVSLVAFSPDGKTVASVGHDGTARFWDPSTGRQRRKTEYPRIWVQPVALSPDTGILAYAESGHLAWLFEATTGRKLLSLGHGNGSSAIAFSPDGKGIASGGKNGSVLLWDVATLEELRKLPDRGRYVSQEKHALEGHEGWVSAVAFSPDGKLVASMGNRGALLLHDAASGELLRKVKTRLRTASCLVFSPDGATLAFSPRGQHMLPSGGWGAWVWHLPADGAVRPLELKPYVGRGLPTARSIAFSPDGGTLALGCGDSTIRLVDVASGEQILWIDGHRGRVNSLAFSPDGKTLVSGSQDTTVLLWDLDFLKRYKPALTEPESPKHMAW